MTEELPTIRGLRGRIGDIIQDETFVEATKCLFVADMIIELVEGVVEAHLKQYPELSDTLYDKNCREVLNSLKGSD